MAPFRVFVASPVYGLEHFRAELMRAARIAGRSGLFEFFFFEEHENNRIPGRTICESIIQNSGGNFDALFVFFREHATPALFEELDYFEGVIKVANPECEIWWSEIYCEDRTPEALSFIGRLQEHNTGLQLVAGDEINDSPRTLTGRFTARVFETHGRRVRNS